MVYSCAPFRSNGGQCHCSLVGPSCSLPNGPSGARGFRPGSLQGSSCVTPPLLLRCLSGSRVRPFSERLRSRKGGSCLRAGSRYGFWPIRHLCSVVSSRARSGVSRRRRHFGESFCNAAKCPKEISYATPLLPRQVCYDFMMLKISRGLEM